MLSALFLTLAGLQAVVPAASGGPAGPQIHPPARVELLEGRASLARAGEVLELTRGGRELQVEGPAYLELRPRSRVALRWNATASLILHGPAVLEWGPLDDARARLAWRFVELEQAHLEVRRGPLRLSFAGGWSGVVESGAGFVRGLPGGGVEWQHDAGLPILLAAPHAPGRVRPPWVVLAGARLRLQPGFAHPEVLSGSGARLLDPYARRGSGPAARDALPPWGGFTWPWETPSGAPGVGPLVGAAPAEPSPPEAGPQRAPGSAATAGEPAAAEAAPAAPGSSAREPGRPLVRGGVLRLTPWGVRRFREPR